jgi:hypothetical protein
MFDTPILLIVFNRLSTTQQVFERIKATKPKNLFIVADGPRKDKPDEAEKCKEVRRYLLKAIDWDVELKTLFREENLGCGKGPALAISWFFEHVESGIILEDDCLPADSFFPFCESMLAKYADNPKIHSIAGTNLLPQYSHKEYSYFFSYQAGIWGWATWRRSWKLYDYSVKQWGEEGFKEKIKNFFTNEREMEVYVNGLDKAFIETNVSWWDYQFIFSRIINECYGIIPQKNLICNIGFGECATHTFDENSEIGFLSVEELVFPLIHPTETVIYKSYDELYREHFFKPVLSMSNQGSHYRGVKKYFNLSKKVIKSVFKK